MIRKIWNILLYIILLVITFCGSLFFRQSFFVVLLLLLIVLPFVSWFASYHAFHNLEVDILTKVISTFRFATAPITFRLKNNSIFPLLHCELLYQFHSLFYQEDAVKGLILPALSKKATSHSIPLKLCRNGCFRATLLSVKTYDYLRFFTFYREVNSNVEIKVLPDATGELPCHATLYQEGFDEYEESMAKGNISSNVTDVREYQAGDRLQKIHWKLSAKVDKLMVKENEATSSTQFFILPELYLPDFTSDYLDRTLDTSFVLAKKLLHARENFFLGCYSKIREDFLCFPIKTDYDLEKAFEEIYYEKTYSTENLGLDIYQRASLNRGSVLQVTHKGVNDANII